MAALEGGIGAVAASSGHSAQFMVISTLARAGDNIVSSSSLYGGTYNQFKNYLPRLGITTKFVTGEGVEEFKKLIDEKTKALYVESIGNPSYAVPDLEGLAVVSREYGVPLVVDNTFAMGGYLLRPIEYGAHIVVHSATKWINGHGTTIAGVVVDSGNFDWTAHRDRFPYFSSPSDGYHGLDFSKAFGKKAFLASLRAETLRDLGSALNPFAAFLLLQGLETLSLRAERHVWNAERLARWLEKREEVAWILYPGRQHRFDTLSLLSSLLRLW